MVKEPSNISVYEILELANDLSAKERFEYLTQHKRFPILRNFFLFAFHPDWTTALPDGETPYKPADISVNKGMLYGEIRRLYLFVNPESDIGHKTLSNNRRESLWIGLMECIDPDDARMLDAAKDRLLHKLFKNINLKLAQKLFPNDFGVDK